VQLSCHLRELFDWDDVHNEDLYFFALSVLFFMQGVLLFFFKAFLKAMLCNLDFNLVCVDYLNFDAG
jgi:hypothetical protein